MEHQDFSARGWFSTTFYSNPLYGEIYANANSIGSSSTKHGSSVEKIPNIAEGEMFS